MRPPFRDVAFAALAAMVLAATALTPAIALAAGAGNTGNQAVTASQTDPTDSNLGIAKEGFNVIRDIRTARIAIFNDDPAMARKLVLDAQVALDLAKSSERALVNKGTLDAPNSWVVVDAQLLIAEDYAMVASLNRTSQALQQGDGETAAQSLMQAKVNVEFARVLMPVVATSDHLEAALRRIDNKQYYDANLVLKAAEDGMNIDTVMLFDPVHGTAPAIAPVNGSKASGS